ncbi:MAG: twin-arginine translocase TatA/TatE family subunit [Rubrimonas sp.]|uniref:twin-arginine translocase TatA/TatE family subunit n=1 Tax=Rubrimonas sp. TaxID=2036015 RepID=UPI002FDDFF04
MSPSIWQILIVVLLVVLLFGRGKISALMGDMAKGIKAFKKGMADDVADETQKVERAADEAVDVTPKTEKKDA